MPFPWERDRQAPAETEQSGPWNNYQPPPQESQQIETPETDRGSAIVNMIGQGLSLRFGDEMAAGLAATVMSPFSEKKWGEIYNDQLQIERANIRAAREQYPVTGAVGEVAGAVGTGYGLAKAGLTMLGRGAQTLPRLAGIGAAEGAIYGGVSGAGGGETADERVAEGLRGAAVGGITGGIFGTIAGVLGRRSPAAETLDELRASSRAAYKASESIGLNINSGAYRNFVGNLEAELGRQGYREGVHTGLRNILREFHKEASTGNSIPLSLMEELRKVARSALSSTDANEVRLAGILMDNVDNFVTNLSSSQTTAGSMGPYMRNMAVDALNDARMYWARLSKGERIEQLIVRAGERAQRSGTSLDVAIRSEFDSLLRGPRTSAGIPRAMRGFTREEVDAARRVVTGGPIENLLRQIAKFDIRSHPYAGAAGSVVGGAIGGPVGAVAVPAAGYLARAGAEATTLRNATLVSELVRRGASTAVTPSAAAAPLLAGLATQADPAQEHYAQRLQQLADLLMQQEEQPPPIPLR